MNNNLKLKHLAIGSLPYDNVEKAMEIVKRDFFEIPFFPQLANLSRNEDMMIQFLEGMPSFCSDNSRNFIFNSEDEKFLVELEEFFNDYEEIIDNINSPKIEKYAITKEFSSTFSAFEEMIKNIKPQYAKGQVVGAFTLSTTINDNYNKASVFDETLRDIIVKHLTLKSLWQIKRIKKASSNTIPIIFMDEPSISQIGTSSYMTINQDDIVGMIREISDAIRINGGISAIHCCGKCDWRIPIKSGVDIINFDAYSFADNFIAYNKEIKIFLENGGKIAWGIVPTLSSEILNNLKIENLIQKFTDSVKKLTKYGIDEKLIIDNSLITSSCGAGSLPDESAELAMNLIKDTAEKLKERFYFDC